MEEQIYFTKKELKELYPAEMHFESVLKQSQLRSAPAWLTKQIAKLYENRYGKKLNKNYNCMTCAFSIYRIVGKAYYESIEHYAKPAPKEEQKTSETVNG